MSCGLRIEDNIEQMESLHHPSICHDDDTRVNNSMQKVPEPETKYGTVDEICTCVEFVTCQDPENDNPTRCGAVDEFCTCVGFITCQDPENYDAEDDIVDNTTINQTQPRLHDALPDPPQPDPPESHTVLVQSTRNNDNGSSESIRFDDGSSRAPIESFDVIVHSPSREQQYNDESIARYSTVTPMTTSTTRRAKPEEYEPLILIIDEEEQDHEKSLSPTSNRAVKDTSSTSSLQYHRRSPMFLSFDSPHQEQKHDRCDITYDCHYDDNNHHKQRYRDFNALIRNEISKRERRKNTIDESRSSAYSIQYNRYSVSKNHLRSSEDTIRSYSQRMHHKIDKVDQYRSSMRSMDHPVHPNTTTSMVSSERLLNDTDTVRAVAPDKIMQRLHPDQDDGHHHHHHGNDNRDDDDDHIFGEPPEYSPHFVPTAKEMIVMVPHSSFHH